MRVHGHPCFLNLYRLYFLPILAGIDTDAWDLDLYLLTPEEMPSHSPNSKRPHFSPPKTIRVPIVEFDSISTDIVFRSNVPVIAHEFGHYIHETFMGEDGSVKWHKFASLTGLSLDFGWQTIDYGKARHPYPYIPAYEEFADDFRDWLRGRRIEMEHFYMSLWGQQAKVTAKDIEIFRGILGDTGEEGARKLKEELERDNPRALVYL